LISLNLSKTLSSSAKSRSSSSFVISFFQSSPINESTYAVNSGEAYCNHLLGVTPFVFLLNLIGMLLRMPSLRFHLLLFCKEQFLLLSIPYFLNLQLIFYQFL